MKKEKLSATALEERKKYFRQWRAKNPDKVKAANRRYWEKKAAQLKAGEADAENETE